MSGAGFAKGETMKLEKGKTYAKADFGIQQPAAMRTDHIIGGELYSFFNMENETLKNEIHTDGFVYGVHHEYNLVEKEAETDLSRHIFVKKDPPAAYEYLGKSCRERRHDNSRNKAFFDKQP
jgi:hypothetical protein